MLNWVMLAVGLVFSASAFRNPLHPHGGHHRHRCAHDQVEVDGIVYETAGDVSPQYQIITACNVTGTWYNSLGSELIITSVDEETGHVTGEYRTAVERRPGAAGNAPGRVSGWTSSDGSHKSIVFSVLWNGGTSATAWTGLCHVCNGVEIMKTTWVLTDEVDACDDHWSSNRIGQDEFKRCPEVPGPRRHLNLHTPSDFIAVAEQFREGILSQDRPGN